MLSFKQFILREHTNLDEATKDTKGWVNPRSKKSFITKRLTPYHVQFVASKPKDFGVTENQILQVLETQNDEMDSPDPSEDAKKDLKKIKSGSIDVNKAVEYLAMKKGWYRVVGGRYAEVSGIKINDKIVSACLRMAEDEGVIPYDGEGIYAIYCQEYKPEGSEIKEKSIKVLEGDAISRAIRGKQTGKRTKVGSTMSMFR